MEYQLKSKEYYEENKKIFNLLYNSITREYISRPKIGCCSFLYHMFKPKSYQDFLEKYLESGKESNFNETTLTGDKLKGRTFEQLKLIAQAYYNAIHVSNVTFEMCLDDLINHCIIETFDGQAAETLVCQLLESTGKYTTVQQENDMDAEMGVDVIVKDKNGKICNFIQVKPVSTFLGYNNASLKRDRANFYMKQAKLDYYLDTNDRSEDKRLIEYMVYDKQKFNDTGKLEFAYNEKRKNYRFYLNELCDTRGNALKKRNELNFAELK